MKGYSPIVRVRTFLHRNFIHLFRLYYNVVWGTNIGKGTRVSLTAKIDRTNPSGVTIGKYSSLAFDSAILTHDFINGQHRQTKVGDYCFIGAKAIIMPGVTVGDHCIIGSGSVVMRDVPPNSIVMGNPGRVMERGIMTGKFGARIASPPSEAGSEESASQSDASQSAASTGSDTEINA
jgi:acetyltransferase-like isoleucine patch superfamily enzyme